MTTRDEGQGVRTITLDHAGLTRHSCSEIVSIVSYKGPPLAIQSCSLFGCVDEFELQSLLVPTQAIVTNYN